LLRRRVKKRGGLIKHIYLETSVYRLKKTSGRYGKMCIWGERAIGVLFSLESKLGLNTSI